MGTRSTTTVIDGTTNETIVAFYRQYDGFPSGHGNDLVKFLEGMEVVNGIPVLAQYAGEFRGFNGAGDLAFRLIGSMKDPGVAGKFYVIPLEEVGQMGDEFIYEITAADGQPIIVKCSTVGWEGNIDSQFRGTVEEFKAWIKENPDG